MSFSKRLKKFIEQKNISQAEAARICGIAQQSMNYILKNDLRSSKLAPTIADSLGINPEWLIYGEGRPQATKVVEIPIIHSPYMLKKYINEKLDINTLDFVILDTFIGIRSFAYLQASSKMAICAFCEGHFKPFKYLTLRDNEITVTEKKTEVSFPIFEWRERYEDF